jgi:hypothetical protein
MPALILGQRRRFCFEFVEGLQSEAVSFHINTCKIIAASADLEWHRDL